MTAANERVCIIKVYQQEAANGWFDMYYRWVIRALYLFNEAHQQHVRLVRCPVVRKVFFGLGSHFIVG
jgi:hypothetical protein